MRKLKLSKDNPVVVKRFTSDMHYSVEILTEALEDIFNAFKNGECGKQIKDLTLRLFDEWLVRSLLPKVGEVKDIVKQVIEKSDNVEEAKRILKRKLSMLSDVEKVVVNIMAEIAKGRKLDEVLNKYVWDLYQIQISTFCIQSSHLIVGRLLMLRVGEDKGAWEPLLMQRDTKHHLIFYWTSRSIMSDFLPSIYNLNELDWLYIPDTVKQGLNSTERRILKSFEDKLNNLLGKVIEKLSQYDFSEVDMDVWKAVYQRFLSPEEINKLGFVTTPDEIVDLILDLAGYREDVEGLCSKTVLDPACGSGTFLVEAMVRLKRHFERKMACHKEKSKKPAWIWEKQMLERIISNIYGIDIHPFATFLTTMNLAFQLLDIYSRVKHKFPDFTLSLNIVTHDALAQKPTVQSIESYVNSRLKEAKKRSQKYAELCDKKFDIVVGNPPWGTVLRGTLGPLGDEVLRKEYKAHFVSATGKYDIFVLFMEKGLKWLKEKGILAMITQVTYVSQAFGKGIKKLIRQEGAIKYFVDLSQLGHIIFPGWTNYPAITVIQKGGTQEDILLIEVKEK